MTTFFSDLLSRHPGYIELEDAIKSGELPAVVSGLSGIHKANFTLALSQNNNKNVLLLVDDDAAGLRICDDINTMCGQDIAAYFPVRDYVFRDMEGVSKETEQMRISVLSSLIRGDTRIVVAPVETALLYTIPKDYLSHRTLVLKPGDEISTQDITEKLILSGYVRRDFVDGICQFSIRGGIVDVFSPGEQNPFRIEFWGDEIDTIAYFETESQRRIENIDRAVMAPASEILYGEKEEFLTKLKNLRQFAKGRNKDTVLQNLNRDIESIENDIELSSLDKYITTVYEKPSTILDYFSDGIICFSEYFQSLQRIKGVEKQLKEDIKLLFEEGILFGPLCDYIRPTSVFTQEIEERGCVILDSFSRSVGGLKLKKLINIEAVTSSVWGGEIAMLKEELNYHLGNNRKIVVFAATDKNASVLANDLISDGYNAVYSKIPIDTSLGTILVTGGMLSAGFEYSDIDFTLISHVRQTGKTKNKHRKISAKERISSIDDLSSGDYVVHVTHGIGIYEGIHKLELYGVTKDYIKIKYSGSDVLYVPVTQLDLVSKYIGNSEGASVKLSKMGSATWQNTKKKVRAAVDDMAKELLDLYAKRKSVKGFVFPEDDEWQRDFEARFPYDETSDQLRCIDEIKRDMMREYPMDRLLCGDVGFGKTEVALRAAFKCVMGGKQCAVLVPTTILAWQHFNVFKKRVGSFPMKIDLMSRFKTPKEQKKVIKELKEGIVDIVIGTHRLIQKDVEILKLGLVIIDEEQRFGVAHKEKFKAQFTGVDVLTLSATPIPRTLNMAMTGIRDMSVIEEPPIDRYPVQTYVMEYSQQVVYEAIRRELRRSGQVFYLHNRVESIEQTASKIAFDFPDANVAFAHGKMAEGELSNIWKKLVENEIDILVCTSIIETGVDVPNCNTLIVENADTLGLSQLYQLRGRVGRSSRRAYAYFTFRRGKVVTEIASKRLAAIREFTKFGSGFRIAMRDLEIRGAGSVLGTSQHGHMESVGYDLYLRMLGEAVASLKGEKTPVSSAECTVDIMMDAHIPEDYIDSPGVRIDVYKKIASIHSDEEKADVLDELIDRFGEPPITVMGLLDVALIRGAAASIGIYEIKQSDNQLKFFIKNVDMEYMSYFAYTFPGRFTLTPSTLPYFTLKLNKSQTPIQGIYEVIGAFKSRQKK